MRKLSEGATAVTAVFLLLTAVVSFFFSVQRHEKKIEHRNKVEEKEREYQYELKKAQDEMRAQERQKYKDMGYVFPDEYPQPEMTLNDFYFREDYSGGK